MSLKNTKFTKNFLGGLLLFIVSCGDSRIENESSGGGSSGSSGVTTSGVEATSDADSNDENLPLGKPTLVVPESLTAKEADGTLEIQMELSHGYEANLTFTFGVEKDPSATRHARSRFDFINPVSKLVIPEKETTGTISIKLLDDIQWEPDGSFILKIRGPYTPDDIISIGGGSVDTTDMNKITITIENDDLEIISFHKLKQSLSTDIVIYRILPFQTATNPSGIVFTGRQFIGISDGSNMGTDYLMQREDIATFNSYTNQKTAFVTSDKIYFSGVWKENETVNPNNFETMYPTENTCAGHWRERDVLGACIKSNVFDNSVKIKSDCNDLGGEWKYDGYAIGSLGSLAATPTDNYHSTNPFYTTMKKGLINANNKGIEYWEYDTSAESNPLSMVADIHCSRCTSQLLSRGNTYNKTQCDNSWEYTSGWDFGNMKEDHTDITKIDDQVYFFSDGVLWTFDSSIPLENGRDVCALEVKEHEQKQTDSLAHATPLEVYPKLYTNENTLYYIGKNEKTLHYHKKPPGVNLCSNENRVGTGYIQTIDGDLNSLGQLTPSGGKLYFTYTHDVYGKELFYIDFFSSNKTPTLVKDIAPGKNQAGSCSDASYASKESCGGNEETWTEEIKGNSNPNDLKIIGDKLYFTAWDPTNGKQIWVTDGTEANTQSIESREITDSESFNNFTKLTENKLIFTIDGSNTPELWVTDGTTGGTKVLKKFPFPKPERVKNPPTDFVHLKDKVYFVAEDAVHGQEVWVTDGTPEGTKVLKDLTPGWYNPENPNAGFEPYLNSSGPQKLVVSGSKLYFIATSILPRQRIDGFCTIEEFNGPSINSTIKSEIDCPGTWEKPACTIPYFDEQESCEKAAYTWNSDNNYCKTLHSADGCLDKIALEVTESGGDYLTNKTIHVFAPE